MAGIATELLPGDAELARRAAGGDGAAFVRLYDHYSADVFEAALAATGEVETASDATQAAFLKLLRRPPAMGAADSEVAERLHGLALRAVAEPPATTRTERGTHAPADAGVGWLRSETVAKAGARFDEDWSVHLEGAPATRPRAVDEERDPPALVMAATAAPIEALPPLAAAPAESQSAPHSPHVRRSPALPSPAVAGVLALLMLFAAAAGVILASGGLDADPQQRAGAVVRQADAARGDRADANDRRPQAGRDGRRGARGARGRNGRLRHGSGLTAAERAFAGLSGADVRTGTRTGSGSTPTGGGVRRPSAGGTAPAGTTPRPGSSSPGTDAPASRTPTAIKAPAPTEPATTPAPQPTSSPEPAPAEPAPAPRENGSGGSGGSGRSCNSKNAPC